MGKGCSHIRGHWARTMCERRAAKRRYNQVPQKHTRAEDIHALISLALFFILSIAMILVGIKIAVGT